ncbi:hypothetical protein LINGRAHAP2_LOCUS19681 [Linum grandiflorum]
MKHLPEFVIPKNTHITRKYGYIERANDFSRDNETTNSQIRASMMKLYINNARLRFGKRYLHFPRSSTPPLLPWMFTPRREI